MTISRDILSGSPDANGSAIDGLATFASLTTIHAAPSGELHSVWMTITNNGVASIEILGDVGESATSFDLRIEAGETFHIGPITLSNTTLKLSATANAGDISVTGSVEKQT